MEIAIVVVGTLLTITITAVAAAIDNAQHSDQRKIEQYRKEALKKLDRTSDEFQQRVNKGMRQYRK